MRTLQRILLPVDFSERSAGAARYAKSLAVHFQAELILYHVLTPPQYEFGALDVAAPWSRTSIATGRNRWRRNWTPSWPKN